MLLRNRGIVLYREVLYERVWGLDAEYDSRTLDLHIQRLRKKLGWKNEIRTVFRVGGHFCGRAARIRGLLCVHG